MLLRHTDTKSNVEVSVSLSYAHEDTENNICPLCFATLAPNIIVNIADIAKANAAPSQLVLSEQAITLPLLLKRFRNGEIVNNVTFEVPLSSESRPISPNTANYIAALTTSFTNPSAKSNADVDGRTKQANNVKNNLQFEAEKLRINSKKLTATSVSILFAEMIVQLWRDYINDCMESFPVMLFKNFIKKKSSPKILEARVQGNWILSYYNPSFTAKKC